MSCTDRRVVLNVGGRRHETRQSTLRKLPGTRLSDLTYQWEKHPNFDATNGEFFFDRSPDTFSAILNLYRTDELHVMSGACGCVLKQELQYWGIEEYRIEACCWSEYSKYTEHRSALSQLDKNFAMSSDEDLETGGGARLEGGGGVRLKQGRGVGGDTLEEGGGGGVKPVEISATKRLAFDIWRTTEKPSSSRRAKAYMITSMSLAVLSILIFVLETHPSTQVDRISGRSMSEFLPPERCQNYKGLDCCQYTRPQAETTGSPPVTDPGPHTALLALDYMCTGFFTTEFIIRAVIHRYLGQMFWKNPLNVIDLICLPPLYISMIMYQLDLDNTDVGRVMTFLRLIRILRIFKVMKHYRAFKILAYTIKVSAKELGLMLVFLVTSSLMFGGIIHYTERDNFTSIPIGIWWALVTMTTVGYGDKFPDSYLGYLVGSFCVISGVLVIAFTVPIVVDNFTVYYSHAKTRLRLPPKHQTRAPRGVMRLERKLRLSASSESPRGSFRGSFRNSFRGTTLSRGLGSNASNISGRQWGPTVKVPPDLKAEAQKSENFKAGHVWGDETGKDSNNAGPHSTTTRPMDCNDEIKISVIGCHM